LEQTKRLRPVGMRPVGIPRKAAATRIKSPARTTPRAKAWVKRMARVGEEFPLACPTCGGDIRLREDGRQEPAHFESEVRKRAKARMASPA
jgi:hypothetical protein